MELLKSFVQCTYQENLAVVNRAERYTICCDKTKKLEKILQFEPIRVCVLPPESEVLDPRKSLVCPLYQYHSTTV
jgi:hypothetical protein